MVPLKSAYGRDPESEESSFAAKPVKEPENVAGFLEVVHLADNKVTYIPVRFVFLKLLLLSLNRTLTIPSGMIGETIWGPHYTHTEMSGRGP